MKKIISQCFRSHFTFMVIAFWSINIFAGEVCYDLKIPTTGGCSSGGYFCAAGKEETQKICYFLPDLPGPIPGGAGAGAGAGTGPSAGGGGDASKEQKDNCLKLADSKKYLCDRDTLAYKKDEYLKCASLFFSTNLLSQCNLLVDNEAKAKDLTCNFNYNNDIAKCDKL